LTGGGRFDPGPEVAPGADRVLAVWNTGFLTQRWLVRALAAAGWRVVPGPLARNAVAVGVWGRRPSAMRGLAAAARAGLPVLTVEDAPLRSVRPPGAGLRERLRAEVPAGLRLDLGTPVFDSSAPSRLERRLATGGLNDPGLLRRAHDGIDFLRRTRLSKFNDWADAPLPDPGFVLVVDQVRDDVAIAAGGAGPADFAAMLAAARAEHPDRIIVIRRHPSAARSGHFGPGDTDVRTLLLDGAANPWDLLDRAHAVYAVTSQLGFEAMLAGHRPVLFGQPFHAGWGLSDDRRPVARRGRALPVAALFAAAMLEHPLWLDADGGNGTFEDAAQGLAARARAWSEDRQGWVCTGFRAWKRRHVRAFLSGRARFVADPGRAMVVAATTGRPLLAWATRQPPDLAGTAAAAGVALSRMEDGFLRSRGLGARLIPAASLVIDDTGIHYDPALSSRLESLIAASPALPEGALRRAAALRAAIVAAGLGKYNIAGTMPPARTPTPQPGQRVVLVAGQVADDASVVHSGTGLRTNDGLLAAARAARPDAWLVWKPHPDVEAGLRPGAVSPGAAALADQMAAQGDIAALIGQADEVWTISSLTGFEALLRGKAVTCLGMPFYAGWGLTQDTGPPCPRRAAMAATATVTLDGLVHAALIDYARYHDPVTGRACSPEVIVARLAARHPALGRNPSPVQRLLAVAQDRLAGLSGIWR
jgi:capsular polysaccharide export protein